jgi:hypothetical protein
MPKNTEQRIIDTPFNRGVRVTAAGGGSTGGGGGGSGSSTLAGLTDVALTGLAGGNLLQFNSGVSKWINIVPNYAPAQHPLAVSAGFHTGLLPWGDLSKSGSNLADLATRQHSDLQGISPDQHHFRVHDLITGDNLGPVHTITGGDYTVVGVHPANTLALLPTSSNPGATQSILKSAADGSLQLDTTLLNVNATAHVVSMDTTLFKVDAATDIVTIDTNLLYADAVNNRIGVNVVPGAGPAGGAAAFDMRAAAPGDITQRIRQIAGQTQRLWRVEDVAGNELIIMDSVGNLQSGHPGFYSGLTGWQITPEGNAEFNNIWARGELHATVFVKDEVHATGGTFFVASAGTLHDDANIDNSTPTLENFQVDHKPSGGHIIDDLTIESTAAAFSGTTLSFQALISFLNINDPPSGPAFYFNPNDTIRSKTEVATGVTDFWLTVNDHTQYDGYARYSVFKRSGTNGVLPKGAAVVSYGQVGDGRIMMTSDLNYAPYLDVFTVGPNVWTGAAGSVIPRLRLGRLDGVGVPGVSGVEQYGMVAGTDLTNANAPYFIASNLQFKLYKINITLNDGSNDTASLSADGNLTLGQNIALTTGRTFQATRDGNLIVGRTAGQYMKWDQAAGTLTINGSLTVGGTDAKTYIDNQDTGVQNAAAADATTKATQAVSTASGDATTKATQAQSNAQSYSEARRCQGVKGNFFVTGYQSMRWDTVSLYFSDGSVVAVGNSGPGLGIVGLSSRTWLYQLGASLLTTSDLTEIGTNTVIVAVFDPGASSGNPGSLSIIAGSTYISGNNIVTGSIVAANIQAGTITGNEIKAQTITAGLLNVNDLSAIKGTFAAVNTGNLTVNGNLVMGQSGTNFGALYSFGKVDFSNATPGYFLGWDTNGGISAYKCKIGDGSNFVQWNGQTVAIKTNQAIQLVGAGSATPLITFFDPGGHVGDFYFSWDTPNSRSILRYDGLLLADNGLQAPFLWLNDTSTGGASSRNILQLSWNAHTHNLIYDSTGILSYDGDFYAANNLVVSSTTGAIVCNGNHIGIRTIKTGMTGSTTSPAGSVGDICWDNGFLYVYVGGGNGWRRATLNSF